MSKAQWNIEHLLADAINYMRDVGMPDQAEAIIELQRRAAQPPCGAGGAVQVPGPLSPLGNNSNAYVRGWNDCRARVLAAQPPATDARDGGA